MKNIALQRLQNERTKIYRLALVCLIFCLTITGSAFAALYVAPNGNDNNDGSKAKPFQSVQKALDVIKQKKIPEKDRLICLADGFYYPEKTILLTQEHNGLTIAAEKGARPVLVGGKPLNSGWKREGQFLTISAQGTDFRFLAVNGVPAQRTRLPEKGKFEHNSVFNRHWMSSSLGGWDVKPTEEELKTMKYKPEDLRQITDLDNSEITLFHMWDETLVRVEHNDTKNNFVTFSTKPAHPAGAFKVKTYIVWNSKHGMKKPGNWYLDRKADKVYYWPKEGENEKNVQAVAPVLKTILSIQKAKDINIIGLAFTGTNTPLVTGGFGAANFPGALEINKSQAIKLDRIAISNVSGQGIKANYVTGLTITNSHIRQTGAKGVAVAGSNVLIENNCIHDIGLLYPSAIAISCGTGAKRADRAALDTKPIYGTSEKDAQFIIRNNEVYNTPYSGITCGGGYNVLIQNNRIHDVMRELGDGAAIYCGGGKHYTMKGNFVYDISSFHGFGSSAYYYDEQADYCSVEGNLSVCAKRPIHFHMTHNNTVTDNIFIVDPEDEATLSFIRDTDVQLLRNLFVGGKKQSVIASGIDPTLKSLENRTLGLLKIKNNVFWSDSKKLLYNQYWKDDKNRVETVSKKIVIDAEHPFDGLTLLNPEIVSDPKSGKIAFKNPDLLKKFGILELDVSKAGPKTPVITINF